MGGGKVRLAHSRSPAGERAVLLYGRGLKITDGGSDAEQGSAKIGAPKNAFSRKTGKSIFHFEKNEIKEIGTLYCIPVQSCIVLSLSRYSNLTLNFTQNVC